MLRSIFLFRWVLLAAVAVQGWGIRSATANLVGYWPLNGDGNAVVGTNGTLVNGPTPSADRNGTAAMGLAFDGAIQQYVSIAGGGGFNGGSEASVSMWVNWSGTQDAACCGGTFGNVLGRQSNGAFSNNIIGLSTSDPATANVTVQGYNAGGPIISAGGPVGDGIWRHIAVTFENGQQRLYVDGAPAGPAASVNSNFNNNPSIPLTIGAWIGDGAGYSTSSIDEVGTFDEFLIEGKARSLFSLAVESDLLYTLDDIDSIFGAYDNQSSVEIDGLTWEFATVTELQDAGLLGQLGEVNNNGQQFGVLFDTAVGGVLTQAQVVPEPNSIAIWCLIGLGLAGLGYTRVKRKQ